MKRSELYERIWSTPASKIADELSISGSRVAAICRRHSIPTPPRGHWAKLSVGKHVPKVPLPQPEADYDIKIGTAKLTRGGSWLADGVLLRPGAKEEPQLFDKASPPPSPAAAWPSPPAAALTAPTQERCASRSNSAEVDLELVRVAAAELQERHAIDALLQAVTARAIRASPDEAKRIIQWASATRALLAQSDPVAGLLRSAALLPMDH